MLLTSIKQQRTESLIMSLLDNMPFGIVPDSYLEKHWEKLAPFIQRAIKESAVQSDTTDDVLEQSLNGESQVWVYGTPDDIKLVVTTKIKLFDNYGNVCIIEYTAGQDLAICQYVFSKIKQWSEDTGCRKIIMYGRDGWKRVLGKLGVKAVGTIYEG